MIIKLLKYISGYVVFTAKGGFAERFINLCAVRRINIWDVSLYETTIKAKVNIRDFKKLRGIVRNTGVKVNIVERCGLPFYLRKHRDRVGLLIGAAVFFFFCTVMNNFVWCINVGASEKISREQILNAAENAGLHYGTRVKNFDEEKAAREIYKASEGKLSWVKVNIKGSLAVIEYREADNKLKSEEKGEISNIVADFDGVIISDETYQGAKNKSRGDAVRKGEVLISGVVEGVDMKPLYYQAKGKFSALHTKTFEYTLNKNTEFLCLEAFDKAYTLHFFGIKVPLGFLISESEESEKYSYETFMEFEGYILPVGINKTASVKYKNVNLSQREKELLTVVLYSNSEYEAFSRTNIINRETRLTKDSKDFRVTGEYYCIDFIGESKAISLENSEIS